MTAEELTLLHRASGRIVAVELCSGEQFFAEVVIVVDEPPTPDSGESHLLAEISRVALIPGIDYPELDVDAASNPES